MEVKLSILICTIPKRAAMFQALIDDLTKQSTPEVQILYMDCAGTVGSKRNRLLNEATGDYVCFIDDDDEVSEKYVESILKAIESGPDCVGIKGIMTTNGKLEKSWEISMRHQVWHETNGIYYRHTNHLSPVKREIALQVGFKDMVHGEDYAYSMGLKGRLKSEVRIEHGIYHYKFMSKK